MWQSLFSKVFIIVALLSPITSFGQEAHQDLHETVQAEVLKILDESEREIIGTETFATIQEVQIKITSGERAGDIVVMTAEIVTLKPGDKIYVNRVVDISGTEYITYSDFERRSPLLFVAILFVAMLLFFSGWHGVRALVSLVLSIAAIIFLLVPALLAGYNPALTSVLIAAVILAVVLFGTHGVNPRSLIAFGGTFIAVVFTGILAYFSVDMMRLSGFSNDASVYLNFATNGSLDLAGLLLGSIIIGILGILDDVSITQASVVQELKSANKNFTLIDLYTRAIKVGRDHIGSLVNTLALAYVGVSLPLILLYAKTESNIMLALNQEVVAAELLRIIVGSIGLILAVPATTFVAAWYFSTHEVDETVELSHSHHHHH